MHPTPPRVRVDERAKNQLTTLKRRTGIKNWNVLCRWALCVSTRRTLHPCRSRDRHALQRRNVMVNLRRTRSRYLRFSPPGPVAKSTAFPLAPIPSLTSSGSIYTVGITYLVGNEDTKTLSGMIALATKT